MCNILSDIHYYPTFKQGNKLMWPVNESAHSGLICNVYGFNIPENITFTFFTEVELQIIYIRNDNTTLQDTSTSLKNIFNDNKPM